MQLVNEVYESSRFHKRMQQPGESVESCYAELCRVVKRCNCPTPAVEDRLLLDQLVVGFWDARLFDQPCRNTKLNLKEGVRRHGRLRMPRKKETEAKAKHTPQSSTLTQKSIAAASRASVRQRSSRMMFQCLPPVEKTTRIRAVAVVEL